MFVQNSFLTRNWYATSFFFLISSANLKLKQHFHTDTFWNYVLLNGAKYQGEDKAEARDTDEQPLSDKPTLIQCGETYST